MNHEYFRHAEILLASQIAKPGFAALCCPPPLLGKDGEKDPRVCLGVWGGGGGGAMIAIFSVPNSERQRNVVSLFRCSP